eukprot:Pgem_evm1s16952
MANRDPILLDVCNQKNWIDGMRKKIKNKDLADVSQDVNSVGPLFDACFSANTVHIMTWTAVEDMLKGVSKYLKE